MRSTPRRGLVACTSSCRPPGRRSATPGCRRTPAWPSRTRRSSRPTPRAAPRPVPPTTAAKSLPRGKGALPWAPPRSNHPWPFPARQPWPRRQPAGPVRPCWRPTVAAIRSTSESRVWGASPALARHSSASSIATWCASAVSRLDGLPGTARLRSRPGRSFNVPFEYGQHAGLHRPDNRNIEPIVDEPLQPPRAEGLVPADDKTCAPVRQLIQQEGPEPFGVGGRPWLLWVDLAAPQISQPAQSQEPIRFKRCHLPGVHRASPCPVLHVVAEGEVLPFLVDFCGTGPTAVVEAIPGVPPPTVTTHLDQPGPDLIWRRVDG